VQVVPKFVYEEGLYYLVVKKDAFRDARGTRDFRWLDYRELILECLTHFIILVLEGAHDVLTSYDEVHDASDKGPVGVSLALVAEGYDVDELHEGHELLMALVASLQKL
jgi:hypothetical protein